MYRRQYNSRPWSSLTLLSSCRQAAIQIVGGADQGQMREGLRKISQVFAPWPQFLGVETEMVGIAESLFKEEPGLFQITRSPQAFDVPEGAHGKRALIP